MKNKILINLISVLLISTFFTTLISTSAHNSDCDRLNKYGQFADETCAVVDSLNRISNGEKFIKLTHVGENANKYYDYLLFDSSEISQILSNLTYNKNVDQILAEKDHNLEVSNKIITGGIFTTGLLGAIYKIFKDIPKNVGEAVDKSFKDNKGFLNKHNFSIMTLTTGVSALLSFLACSINNIVTRKQESKILDRSCLEKRDYLLTLKMILSDIEYNRLKPDKVWCIRLRSPDDEWIVGDELPSAQVTVLNKKSSKELSIDEQNKFNEDLKKLKEDITTILKENGR